MGKGTMNVVDVKRQPTIEELHEPDQTVLTVKLDASGGNYT